MAQFDVYRNTNDESADEFPYLLDIQADLLCSLATRVVIPLVRQEKNIQHLNPIFEIKGERVAMLTQELSGIEQSILGKKVCSLSERRIEIIAALDFLVSGFWFVIWGSFQNRLSIHNGIGEGEIDGVTRCFQALSTPFADICFGNDYFRIITIFFYQINNIIQRDILADTDGHRSTCPTNLDILFKIFPPRRKPNPHAS